MRLWLRLHLIKWLIGDIAVVANGYFHARHYPQFVAEPADGLLMYDNLVEGEETCGHECHWASPFGFVPEAGCLVHEDWPEPEMCAKSRDIVWETLYDAEGKPYGARKRTWEELDAERKAGKNEQSR